MHEIAVVEDHLDNRLLLTANAMPGDRESLLDLGFDDYISKPLVEEFPLLRCIERLLAPTPQEGARSKPGMARIES